MGLNYYLIGKPTVTRPCVHLGKSSYGWKPSFEASDGHDANEWYDNDDDPRRSWNERPASRPAVNSMADVRSLVDQGWEIWDEEGRFVRPEEFFAEMEAKRDDPDCKDHLGYGYYRDPEGFEFTRSEFC